MAVALRLMRFGKKKFPFYRIVALDKRKKRDGSYIEKVGQYDPMIKENTIKINKTRFDYWQSQGAQISEGLTRLLKNKKSISYTEDSK
ncbi:MAG: 30S ribosomal protein S16 [bacterium]|nr:30S ribosomal protein S16 [bacterium]